VTLAFGRTAPVASVTLPEILPVAIEVWPNATEDNSSADRATNASTTNRALEREEFRVDIVNLPFGNVLIGIVFTFKLSRILVSQNFCRKNFSHPLKQFVSQPRTDPGLSGIDISINNLRRLSCEEPTRILSPQLSKHPQNHIPTPGKRKSSWVVCLVKQALSITWDRSLALGERPSTRCG
jgi:hypothetical protein